MIQESVDLLGGIILGIQRFMILTSFLCASFNDRWFNFISIKVIEVIQIVLERWKSNLKSLMRVIPNNTVLIRLWVIECKWPITKTDHHNKS